MRSGVILLICLAPSFIICLADAVVFETWFGELPYKWYSDGEWEYNHPGAYAYWATSTPDDYWDALMTSCASPPYYITYFVPDGTDSLVVTIMHELQLLFWDYGEGDAQVVLYATNYGEITIYNMEAVHEDIVDTQPITYTLADPLPGTYIGFTFYVQGYEWEPPTSRSTVHWTIDHLLAVACGDSLALQTSTWADIKQLLRE